MGKILKSLILVSLVLGGTFCSRLAFSDELADLKEEIKLMEERHQQEMETLRARIQALEAKSEQGQVQVREEGPASAQEELVFIEEQQQGILQRLDEAVRFDLYGTLEFRNFENQDSVIDARNMEFLADARMTDRLRALIELEFERLATTESGAREGAVEVEQGWLEYSIHECFNPRFGAILVPFGRFNLEHFQPVQDLSDRPLVARRVVPVSWAEAGVGFTGKATLGEAVSFNHQFYVVNGLTDAFKDTSLRDGRGAFGRDNNSNKAVVGRLGVIPLHLPSLDEAELGLSGYFGEYDRANHDIGGFDTDLKLVKGPFEVLGEFAVFDVEEGGFEASEDDEELIAVPDQLWGFYIQLGYHFWFDVLNSTFLGRGFEAPTFTAILRYDRAEISDDGDLGTGNNEEERWTVGLNYRPVESWVFKCEYQFNRKDNETLEHGDDDGFISSVSAVF